jgi:hypothetical protein
MSESGEIPTRKHQLSGSKLNLLPDRPALSDVFVIRGVRISVNVNKSTLVRKIIARLTDNLGLLQKAAQASHAEATHESSKAENKYDTRGLEAAYLAGGQARQVKEIQDSIQIYDSLTMRPFSTGDPIDLTAVVDLETDGVLSTYFLGPKAGGLEIEHGGREILVITPQSPLGKNLIGRKPGERWLAELNRSKVKFHVVSVA